MMDTGFNSFVSFVSALITVFLLAAHWKSRAICLRYLVGHGLPTRWNMLFFHCAPTLHSSLLKRSSVQRLFFISNHHLSPVPSSVSMMCDERHYSYYNSIANFSPTAGLIVRLKLKRSATQTATHAHITWSLCLCQQHFSIGKPEPM